jgi:hypothetical protein
MAAPTTLYVKDSAATEWRILSGITDWARCIIPVTGATYRDTGWFVQASVKSGSTVPEFTNVPAIIPDGTLVAASNAGILAQLQGSVPDEMSHTHPCVWSRQRCSLSVARHCQQ